MATNTTSKHSLLTLLMISYLISAVHVITIAEARNLQITSTVATDHSAAANLMDCWNAGLELKSCTDEIVKFFLRQAGISTSEPAVEDGIDKDCCGAIELIVKDCWSVMFTALGLTTMEGNNLREYCEIQADKMELSPSPAPELSPSPSPAPELSPSPTPENFALSSIEITYP